MQESFEDLVIVIYWIGYSVDKDLFDNKDSSFKEKIEQAGILQEDKERQDETKLFNHFELTYDGKPLCINEYATWIAMESNTHVVQMDEHFDLGANKMTPEDYPLLLSESNYK